MADNYRIFGAELSPYSVKVRSYFRYKKIPHEWVVRNASSADEYQKYAKIPIIPLVVSPDGESLQDSTPIIEAMEDRFPDPSIHPNDPICRFVSCLLEEFGDEWGNKWMFHLRWARDEDCLSAGGRIAGLSAPDLDETARLAIRDQVIERMRGRVFFVGSNQVTGPQIEQSFQDAIALLNEHLSTHPYLFGARPAFADFGLWSQIYNAWTDPTGSAWIEGRAPHLLDWIHRMLWPAAQGEFESWESLAETLMPFLRDQVGELFIPWTLANSEAIAAGEDELTVELKGQRFIQKPQKYHAKSLGALREKYASVAGNQGLTDVLACSGCLAGVAA